MIGKIGRILSSKRSRRWAFGIALVVFIASVGTAAYATIYGPSVCTSTVIWGRADCITYVGGKKHVNQIPTFNNNFFVNKNDYNASFTASIFKHDIRDRLFNGNTNDTVSATVLVDVMLGKKGPEFNGNMAQATQFAKDHIDTWDTLIDSYENAKLINWDSVFATTVPYENAGYDSVANDVAHDTITSDFIRVITFNNKPGTTGIPFKVQYGCGNLIGEPNGLPTTPPPPPGTPPPGTPPPGTPPPGTPPPGTPPPTTPPPSSNPPTGDINKPTGNPPGFNTGDSAVNSSCQVISGHAFDPATPNTGIKVSITFSTGGPPLTTTASTSGSHAYTLNTPDVVRSSLVPVTVSATGTTLAGKQYTLTNSPITIGPCVIITGTCVGATTTPAIPDPNASYSVSATVQYGTADDAAKALAQPDFKFFLRITGPNGPSVVYDNPNVPGATRNGNQVSIHVDNLPPTGKPGTYEIGWGVTGTYGAVKCGSSIPGNKTPPTFSSLNKPYFNVHGGDVSVGAAMSPASGDSCTVKRDDDASIVSWNIDPTSGDYRGAGTQYAAFALNHIQEFTTAQSSTAIPKEPGGLAFANYGLPPSAINTATGLYGGKLGGSNCVASYFANATPANTTTGRVNLSSLKDFPVGGNVPNGARLIYYIDGDLLVDSNVSFSGSYADTRAIPTFAVVVKGNIYVQPGIHQLDGFYIAQPSTSSSTDGIIYTCAPSGFDTNAANVLTQTLQESCKTQLTVNGAFLARQIWLLRTFGSVATAPAETFNYVPELWLTAPFGSGLSRGYDDYDAITSLPPVL